jgi:HEAT repeat protein
MTESDLQPDLFSGSGFTPADVEPLFGDWEPLDATAMTDAALVRSLPTAGLREAPALASEAARRKLTAAVPALAELCRRFTGFGRENPIPEQRAALSALAQIGGHDAADKVAGMVADGVVQNPGLPAVASAAAALRCRLPADIVLAWLRDPRPEVRADACRLVRPSTETAAVLIDLLSDLHDRVTAAAASALGQMGRAEARPVLLRLLANAPSPAAINAFAGIADDDGIVVLGRLAISRPYLASTVLAALDEIDLPRAAQVAAGVRRRMG